jgi:hypothetical protein
VNSNIEAERDHLRVGDHIVRVLTMKEAIAETRPLALDALLKIPANFRVVTEWTPLAADKARKEVNKRRRHTVIPALHDYRAREESLRMEGYYSQFPWPVSYCDESSIHLLLVVIRQVFRDNKNT